MKSLLHWSTNWNNVLYKYHWCTLPKDSTFMLEHPSYEILNVFLCIWRFIRWSRQRFSERQEQLCEKGRDLCSPYRMAKTEPTVVEHPSELLYLTWRLRWRCCEWVHASFKARSDSTFVVMSFFNKSNYQFLLFSSNEAWTLDTHPRNGAATSPHVAAVPYVRRLINSSSHSCNYGIDLFARRQSIHLSVGHDARHTEVSHQVTRPPQPDSAAGDDVRVAKSDCHALGMCVSKFDVWKLWSWTKYVKWVSQINSPKVFSLILVL